LSKDTFGFFPRCEYIYSLNIYIYVRTVMGLRRQEALRKKAAAGADGVDENSEIEVVVAPAPKGQAAALQQHQMPSNDNYAADKRLPAPRGNEDHSYARDPSGGPDRYRDPRAYYPPQPQRQVQGGVPLYQDPDLGYRDREQRERSLAEVREERAAAAAALRAGAGSPYNAVVSPSPPLSAREVGGVGQCS